MRSAFPSSPKYKQHRKRGCHKATPAENETESSDRQASLVHISPSGVTESSDLASSNSSKTAHSKKRLFTCEICGRAFSNHRSCQRHQLMHTGKSPFVCQICGASFNYDRTLRLHVKACRARTARTENETGGQHETSLVQTPLSNQSQSRDNAMETVQATGANKTTDQTLFNDMNDTPVYRSGRKSGAIE